MGVDHRLWSPACHSGLRRIVFLVDRDHRHSHAQRRSVSYCRRGGNRNRHALAELGPVLSLGDRRAPLSRCGRALHRQSVACIGCPDPATRGRPDRRGDCSALSRDAASCQSAPRPGFPGGSRHDFARFDMLYVLSATGRWTACMYWELCWASTSCFTGSDGSPLVWDCSRGVDALGSPHARSEQ